MPPSGALPLVGRESELALLEAQLAAAADGLGSVVLLTGEAGIGKTRIIDAFVSRARNQNALVLLGRCYEGEGGRPYGPWTELLSEYAVSPGLDHLERLMGEEAEALGSLLPGLAGALPPTARMSAIRADDQRFRLHDAVAQLALRSAIQQPVLLVLDDLHWADGDSLWLLRHVARFARRGRVLLVVAYRESEVEAQHPIAATLASIRHDAETMRLALGGLSFDETSALLGGIAGQSVPQAIVQRIFEHAEGSPFYTRELWRYLVEEGVLVKREGHWSTDHSLRQLGVPDGVRQVVGRRLARLSEPTRSLLHHACTFRGAFSFDLLRQLTGFDEPRLLDCLDEGLAAGLLRGAPGAADLYDFAHAIVRQTLYGEASPSRRARLHRRVAELLQSLQPRRGDEDAAEIAAQYWASASLPSAELGIPYALRAADQARARQAHQGAVEFLRMARDLSGDRPAAGQLDILQRLAVAEAEAILFDDASRTIEQVLDQRQDLDGVVSFLESVSRALKEGGAPHETWEPLVDRALAMLGGRRDLVWARLVLLQDRYSEITHGVANVVQWVGQDGEAVAVARSLGNEDDWARTLDPLDWRTRSETEAAWTVVRGWTRPSAILHGLNAVARDLFYRHGDYVSAADRYRDLLDAAHTYGTLPSQAEALAQLSVTLSALGEFDEAERLLPQARQLVMRLGPEHRLHFVVNVGAPTAIAYFKGGDWARLATLSETYMAAPAAVRSPLGLMALACAAVASARVGNAPAAERLVDMLLPFCEQLDPRTYMLSHVVCITGVMTWELQLRRRAARVLHLARALVDVGATAGLPGGADLTVARMSLLLGDLDGASTWFERARIAEDAAGQRPARAIVDLEEGKHWLGRGQADRARGYALIETAAAQFAALGMPPWSDAARQVLESKAGRAPRPDRLTTRELEVLRLLAQGQTTKEMADALVLSVPTVQRHLANIYLKIDARGRSDATAYALRQGIVPLLHTSDAASA
jgi:DNA-binding CsgD family transcriptional regulator